MDLLNYIYVHTIYQMKLLGMQETLNLWFVKNGNFAFKKIFVYLFLALRATHTRELPFTGFLLQMPTIVWAGPDQSQEHRP